MDLTEFLVNIFFILIAVECWINLQSNKMEYNIGLVRDDIW